MEGDSEAASASPLLQGESGSGLSLKTASRPVHGPQTDPVP
jgi:hypothetical protein